MKKLKLLFPLLLGLLMLTACSDDDNEPNAGYDGTYHGTYTSNEGDGVIRGVINSGRIDFVNVTENVTVTGTVSGSGDIYINQNNTVVTGKVTLAGTMSGSFTAANGAVSGIFSATRE